MLSTLLAVLMTQAAAPPPAEEQRLDGIYENGFELSVFTPCDGDGVRYWVAPGAIEQKLTDDIKRQIRKNGAAPGVRRYRVKLTGALSEPGEWGHMGMYPRVLNVTEVHSFTPTTLNDDVLLTDCGLTERTTKKST